MWNSLLISRLYSSLVIKVNICYAIQNTIHIIQNKISKELNSSLFDFWFQTCYKLIAKKVNFFRVCLMPTPDHFYQPIKINVIISGTKANQRNFYNQK